MHLKSVYKRMFLYKWPLYDLFWPFFSHTYVYLSQNWGSDGHFEVLNRSTVWTLLHNQTNQTNSANLAICAAFLVVKIISSDHFLLLTIISSHSMSIKSKKLEFFPKFQKFALWISWFNFAYNSKTGAFLCKPSWIYFKYIKM